MPLASSPGRLHQVHFLIPNKLHSELHQLAIWVENNLETPSSFVALQPFISRYLAWKSNFHDVRSRKSWALFAGSSVQEQDACPVLFCRVGASPNNPKSGPSLQVLDVSEILHTNGRLVWYEPPTLQIPSGPAAETWSFPDGQRRDETGEAVGEHTPPVVGPAAGQFIPCLYSKNSPQVTIWKISIIIESWNGLCWKDLKAHLIPLPSLAHASRRTPSLALGTSREGAPIASAWARALPPSQ